MGGEKIADRVRSALGIDWHETTPDGAVTLDPAGRILSLNEPAERLFGYPRIALKQMMGWVAEWVAHEQRMLGKPTKFEKRDGKY